MAPFSGVIDHPFGPFEMSGTVSLSFSSIKATHMPLPPPSASSVLHKDQPRSTRDESPEREEKRSRSRSRGQARAAPQRLLSPTASKALTPKESKRLLAAKQTRMHRYFSTTPDSHREDDHHSSRQQRPLRRNADDDEDFVEPAQVEKREAEQGEELQAEGELKKAKKKRKLRKGFVDSDEEDGSAPTARKRRGKKEAEEEQCDDDAFVQIDGRSHLGMYSTQAGYNATTLAALRAEFTDIRHQHSSATQRLSSAAVPRCTDFSRVARSVVSVSAEKALYDFWQQVNLAPAVSLCLLLFNGSTSFRAASDGQKKRFRTFARQVALRKDRATAKDIDTYEMRERGVQKAIGVLFLFHPHPNTTVGTHPTLSCRFLLPLWQAKGVEPLSVERREQVSQVMQAMLGLASLEKVAFDTKELLCCLVRAFHWEVAPALLSVVDVQLAAWLLAPNAGEKDRVKYQLLPLLLQHCQHESAYPIDVSDKPADILRALLMDLLDVQQQLWPAVHAQLARAQMLDVFTVQVSTGHPAVSCRAPPPASLSNSLRCVVV